MVKASRDIQCLSYIRLPITLQHMPYDIHTNSVCGEANSHVNDRISYLLISDCPPKQLVTDTEKRAGRRRHRRSTAHVFSSRPYNAIYYTYCIFVTLQVVLSFATPGIHAKPQHNAL